MQKLHQFFLLTLLTCSAQSEAMKPSSNALAVQQCLLSTEKNFTPQEFAFELFCRGHFFIKPDREMLLEYIKDPFQDVNKCTPGIILFKNDAAKQPWHKNIKIDDKCRQP